MRKPHVIGAGIAAFALLCACRSALAPVTPPAASLHAASGSSCASSARRTASANLSVCVLVPASDSSATLEVTDSLYGSAAAQTQTSVPASSSQCSVYGSGNYRCVFPFSAPRGVNQVEVDLYVSSSESAGGTFPVIVGSSGTAFANAVLGGTITSLRVIPYLTTDLSGSGATKSWLPVGYQQGTGQQDEGVWIEALDGANVVIGSYGSPGVTIAAQGNLTISETNLQSSKQAESLTVAWKNGELGSGSGEGSLTASDGSINATADIFPSSGVVYYQAGKSGVQFGGGPAVVGPDGNVYFAVNDDDCSTKGSCAGGIYQFDTSTQRLNPKGITLRDVPGVAQLYATGTGASDGQLWVATFQPNGAWSEALPVYTISLKDFPSVPRPLPATYYGNASGFIADATKTNIFISRCSGSQCGQYHDGQPVVVETKILGSHSHYEALAKLPTSCAGFGYLGFSVGDVALWNKQLYVLGLNDGSAPPAHGALWQVPLPLNSKKPTCNSHIPANFNPSPYFAPVRNDLLVGIGGNAYNVRWAPNNGFYAVTSSGAIPAADSTPYGTPTHISSYGNSGVLYYVANGVRSLRLYGLGTFLPQVSGNRLTGHWNVFPNAAFTGVQWNNGVAAVSDGAWFTASNVCGDSWTGVCLGRARYYGASNWGTLPQLMLPAITPSQGAVIGVVADPDSGKNFGAIPFIAHSGPPFYVKARFFSSSKKRVPGSCAAKSIGYLSFSVSGSGTGTCILTIGPKYGNQKRTQILIANVQSDATRVPGPRFRAPRRPSSALPARAAPPANP